MVGSAVVLLFGSLLQLRIVKQYAFTLVSQLIALSFVSILALSITQIIVCSTKAETIESFYLDTNIAWIDLAYQLEDMSNVSKPSFLKAWLNEKKTLHSNYHWQIKYLSEQAVIKVCLFRHCALHSVDY